MSFLDSGDTGSTGVDVGDIGHSLRFRGAQNINKSTVSGNTVLWTWSAFIKRGKLATDQQLLVAQGAGANYMTLAFYSAPLDALEFQFVSTNFLARLTTNRLFRDISSFYHIVFVWDSNNATAADRARLYINGVRETSFLNSTYPALGQGSYINNSAFAHVIGSLSSSAQYFDGYMSRICFVDGQALDPSTLGYLNSETNAWVSKSQSAIKAIVDAGGANSFMLDFGDGTSLTTLGNDKSNKGNNWTLSNFSLTPGSNYDWMLDTPSNNFCVMNSIDSGGATVSEAGLASTTTVGGIGGPNGTIGMSSGKWYWEMLCASGNLVAFTGVREAAVPTSVYPGAATNSVGYYQYDGTVYVGGSIVSIGSSSWSNGSVIGFAFDADARALQLFKNGVLQGTISSGIGPGTYFPAHGDGTSGERTSDYFNFGQRPFTYTPPAGFKSLCTANLPDSAIPNPKRHFDVVLATGPNIKLTAEAVFPGNFFEWIKDRANVNNHQLIDTVRGSSNVLQSNTTAAEGAYSTPAGSSVGLVLKAGGPPVANTAGTIAAQVSANKEAGFSVVTYPGNNTTGGTVGHGLSLAPQLTIVKRRTGGIGSWLTYVKSLGTGFLFLEKTNAYNSAATYFTSHSTSLLMPGLVNNGEANGLDTYVAYNFHDVDGYQKIGSYTGNGSVDGPFVYCGFRPRYLLVKRADAVGNWYIYDTVRDTYNQVNLELYPNLPNSEANNNRGFDLVANGFKARTTSAETNASGGTYIFLAIAEQNFKYANAR